MNWDDGYLAAVRALLKRVVGEPRLAQLQVPRSLARLLKAVPAWMLAFGDANNQFEQPWLLPSAKASIHCCTAHAGFQLF